MRAMKWINVILFSAMVIINMLANFIPLGGKTTGEISSGYPTLFTPAPYTFSIWGVIYILMAIFVIFQIGFIKNTTEVTSMSDKIGIFFAISCILNIFWIFTWHYNYIGFSVITIALLLVNLIIINRLVDTMDVKSISGLLCNYGFQIYLGWITAATIANISVFLVKNSWSRFGISDTAWTIIVLAVGALIGVGFVLKSNYIFSTLAIIWAYCGILIKHTSVNGYNGGYRSIITSLLVCIAVMALTIIISAFIIRKEDQLITSF